LNGLYLATIFTAGKGFLVVFYSFVIPDASFAHECNEWTVKLSNVVSSNYKSMDASLRWHDKKITAGYVSRDKLARFRLFASAK
jgi:hypothetical protein